MKFLIVLSALIFTVFGAPNATRMRSYQCELQDKTLDIYPRFPASGALEKGTIILSPPNQLPLLIEDVTMTMQETLPWAFDAELELSSIHYQLHIVQGSHGVHATATITNKGEVTKIAMSCRN